MRRTPRTLLLAPAIAMLLPVLAVAGDAFPAVQLTGPTIVAFFPPVTQKQVNADLNLGETLGDFQAHLRRAKRRLEASGIKVHELYTRQFQVKRSIPRARSVLVKAGSAIISSDRALNPASSTM